jgi:hypothetical protein
MAADSGEGGCNPPELFVGDVIQAAIQGWLQSELRYFRMHPH